MRSKQLREQRMVITGASSGIGLVTARRATARGARVMLVARNEEALRRIVEEIDDAGGRACYAVADVGDADQVERVGEMAREQLGGVDTWVNNAGITIFGGIDKVPLEDHKRLFDTDYWGVVHGCRVALTLMRARGGTIINLGSAASDRALPMQGPYSAAKHAVKAFTDALRMELEHDGVPVSVTLIKPGSIATPYIEHARNYMTMEPRSIPPVYAPEVVADAILHAAVSPVRDVVVGASAELVGAVSNLAPRATDRLLETTGYAMQQTDRPPRMHEDSLYKPGRDGFARGTQDSVYEHSGYTDVSLQRGLHGLMMMGNGALQVGLAVGRVGVETAMGMLMRRRH